MRKALGRQLQPQLMNLCTRNKHRGAAAGRLIGDFRFFQFIHNPRRILRIEVREQHLHIGLLRP